MDGWMVVCLKSVIQAAANCLTVSSTGRNVHCISFHKDMFIPKRDISCGKRLEICLLNINTSRMKTRRNVNGCNQCKPKT